MTQSTQAHPDTERLRAFGLGRLAADDMDSIEAHVANCDSCCQELLAQGDDELVALVHDSQATAPEQSDQDAASTAGFPAPDTMPAEPDVPSELRDHPRYRIIRRLGSGGMGTVYQAEHRLMKKTVAVKVIKRDLIGRTDLIERFHREMRSSARLAHPNIVIAHDADQAGSLHFLVLEFVEGTDLARVVREGGPLPVARACDYAWQVALGLQHACDRGMVHRDIKPANLMVTPEGRVKIMDFGLARFAREIGSEDAHRSTADTDLTERGMLLGTHDFLAPEQADDPHTADIRADIYSLGCTLYYLLSGRPPFPELAGIKKLKAHAHQAPEPIDRLRPDVPPTLLPVLDRMMAKDPADRYQTPAEVARALAPFARLEQEVPVRTADVPAAPWKPDVPVPPPATGKVTPRTRRRIGSAAAAALVLALVATIFWLGDWRNRPADRARAEALVETAREEMAKREDRALKQAIHLCEEAAYIDRTYAPAYTVQAACYILRSDYGWLPATVAFPKAKKAVEMALKYDKGSAEARATRGVILYSYDFEWPQAEQELRAAIKLDPKYAEAHHWYAWYLAQLDRFEEALIQIDLACDINPLSRIYATNRGKILYYRGEYDKAISQLRLVLDMHPDYTKAIIDLGLAYEQSGDYDEALALFEGLPDPVRTDDTQVLAARGRIYVRTGRTTDARTNLKELLRRRDKAPPYISPCSIATLYAALGQTEEAFKMLEVAWQERDSGLAYLKVDPRLSPLHKDPRFRVYLRRVGLAP